MKATYALMTNERQLSLEREEIDPQELGPEEILVQAEASVVSAGTELANFLAISPGVRIPGSWNAYPWRPGSGLVGQVVGVGQQASRFSPGSRVFCFGKHASLQRFDISGNKPHQAGYLIPGELESSHAMMARMALISMAALQMARVSPGDRVVVFGLGLVGNLAAQLFKCAGARVMGLDVVEARCRIAGAVGIEHVVPVPEAEQLAAVQEWTGGAGVDIAVDAVGASPVAEACVEVCAPFGQVILLGSPRAAHPADMTPMLRRIHHDWITMVGALEWRLPPYPFHGYRHSIASNLQLALDLISEGDLKVDALVTHVIPPERLGEAYHGLWQDKEHYLGVVVDWRAFSSR
jgi:2-desacetyl-2-hydroxyethyl bacteriochlorophyllide A dehydrogenase